MNLLDNDLYYETKNIVLGNKQRSPMLVEFSEWLFETFNIKVINIDFRKLEHTKTNSYRLRVIIKEFDDFKKISADRINPIEEYKNQTANKFQELATKYKFANEEQLGNFFVVYDIFFWEVKSEINHKTWDEVKVLLKVKYPVIWEVHIPTVFYYLDSDIETYKENGISDQIKTDYYEIIKQYDDLNYFTKENISLFLTAKKSWILFIRGIFSIILEIMLSYNDIQQLSTNRPIHF